MFEGLTELRKDVRLTVMVYYGERIQMKIIQGNRSIGWSPRETRLELPVVLTQWSHRDSI